MRAPSEAELRYLQPPKSTILPAEGASVEMQRFGPRPVIVATINGVGAYRFIVDTGATLVSMSGREARRLGIDYRLEGTPATSSTASGISAIYIVRLDRVKVGDIEMRNVRAAIHDGDFPARALLGMSFLNRVELRRDGDVLELRQKF